MATRPNLPAITGLRFFLALLIVFEHQSGPEGMLQLGTRPVPVWLANLFMSGYAAVGFFFLLSGFVLAYGYNLAEPWGREQRQRFYLARAARIYPAYALGLLLALPFALAKLPGEALNHTWLRAAPFLLAPALLQSWLPSAAGIWNGPGWSLSDEAFFYAVFPLLGCLLWKVRGIVWPLGLMGVIWMYTIVAVTDLAFHFDRLLLHVHGTTFVEGTRWVAILNFNPLLNLPEFLMGILAARVFLHLQAGSGWLRPGRGAWLYLPAIAGELAALTQASHVPYVWMHSGLLLPLHAAVIMGLGLGGGWLPKFLSTRTMLLLGQSSYALYLLHGPLKSMWLWAAQRTGLPAVGYVWFGIYAGVSVAVSIAVFLRVEEPLRLWILRGFHPHRASGHPVLHPSGSAKANA